MKLAYTFKILAALGTDAPVELHRSLRPYSPRVWAVVTRELDQAWTCWCEYTLADKHTLTPRPRVREYNIQGRNHNAKAL